LIISERKTEIGREKERKKYFIPELWILTVYKMSEKHLNFLIISRRKTEIEIDMEDKIPNLFSQKQKDSGLGV